MLGGIAMRAYLGLLEERGRLRVSLRFLFATAQVTQLPGGLPRLFASYHPSQQNTFTGKLTDAMLLRVLRNIRKFLNNRTADLETVAFAYSSAWTAPAADEFRAGASAADK